MGMTGVQKFPSNPNSRQEETMACIQIHTHNRHTFLQVQLVSGWNSIFITNSILVNKSTGRLMWVTAQVLNILYSAITCLPYRSPSILFSINDNCRSRVHNVTQGDILSYVYGGALQTSVQVMFSDVCLVSTMTLYCLCKVLSLLKVYIMYTVPVAPGSIVLLFMRFPASSVSDIGLTICVWKQ